MTRALDILAVDHFGVRVLDSVRSEAFYEKLGFAVTVRVPEANVVILRNAHGVEVNLIVNADPSFDGTNVLMDEPTKRAGHTHVALRVASIDAALETLRVLGVEISEGPVALGSGTSIFVRDPDRNVIELRSPNAR